MKTKLKKEFIRRIEYGGYYIYLYKKRETEKAIELRILNLKMELTKETIWIPKASIKKEGIDYFGTSWIFDKYENREKIERAGYRLW